MLKQFKVNPDDSILIQSSQLRELVSSIFEKMGVTKEDADLGADVLDSHMSPARPEYWESDGQPPARKIRRVDSDPQSPTR